MFKENKPFLSLIPWFGESALCWEPQPSLGPKPREIFVLKTPKKIRTLIYNGYDLPLKSDFLPFSLFSQVINLYFNTLSDSHAYFLSIMFIFLKPLLSAILSLFQKWQ